MSYTEMTSSERERVFLKIHLRKTLSYRTFNRLNGFQRGLLLKLTKGPNAYTRLALAYYALKKREGTPIRIRKAAKYAISHFNPYVKWQSRVDGWENLRGSEKALLKEFQAMGFKPMDQVTMEEGMNYLVSNRLIHGVKLIHPQPCYGYITKRRKDTPYIYDFLATHGIPGYTKVLRPLDEVDRDIEKKKERRKL